jgi:hypothetical protein
MRKQGLQRLSLRSASKSSYQPMPSVIGSLGAESTRALRLVERCRVGLSSGPPRGTRTDSMFSLSVMTVAFTPVAGTPAEFGSLGIQSVIPPQATRCHRQTKTTIFPTLWSQLWLVIPTDWTFSWSATTAAFTPAARTPVEIGSLGFPSVTLPQAGPCPIDLSCGPPPGTRTGSICSWSATTAVSTPPAKIQTRTDRRSSRLHTVSVMARHSRFARSQTGRQPQSAASP